MYYSFDIYEKTDDHANKDYYNGVTLESSAFVNGSDTVKYAMFAYG